MEGIYSVSYQGDTLGQVCLKQQGLYYRVSCRCRLPERKNYVLELRNDEKKQNLGILYPVEQDHFGLDMMISAKKLGQGRPEFHLLPKSDPRKEVVLDAPIPTEVLQQLEYCRLSNQAGVYYLVLQPEKNI